MAITLRSSQIECERFFEKIIFAEASPVNESRLRVQLLFVLQIKSLHDFNAHPGAGLILQSLPLEPPLFQQPLDFIVYFERAVLHKVVQIDSDALAVHGLPDVVKTQVKHLLKTKDRGQMEQIHALVVLCILIEYQKASKLLLGV